MCEFWKRKYLILYRLENAFKIELPNHFSCDVSISVVMFQILEVFGCGTHNFARSELAAFNGIILIHGYIDRLAGVRN